MRRYLDLMQNPLNSEKPFGFIHTLNERATVVHTVLGPTSIMINPLPRQIEALTREGDGLRWIMDDYDLYIWKAKMAIHTEMAKLLGVEIMRWGYFIPESVPDYEEDSLDISWKTPSGWYVHAWTDDPVEGMEIPRLGPIARAFPWAASW